MVELAKTRQQIEQHETSRILDQISYSVLAVVGVTVIVAPSLNFTAKALLCLVPTFVLTRGAFLLGKRSRVVRERKRESIRRGGAGTVEGSPPERSAIRQQLQRDRQAGRTTISKYLVGFELESGEPLWVDEKAICTHAAIFAKTGVGKTLWMLSILLQQMARGGPAGATFIDAKRDAKTLSQIIFMAITTGRIEDLIIVDPFDPVHCYNFLLTDQRPDVKSRKVLRAGLPPIADSSTAKHYDRLASDAIYRIVRALEATGVGYTLQDVSATLNSFSYAYSRITKLLKRRGEVDALTELSHLLNSYTDQQGDFHIQKVGDNLRGIASELHSISGSELGRSINTSHTELNLTEAMLSGKIVYYMLPRLEEAESASRMMKIFREELEISVGEITSSSTYNLEHPHLVMVDEAGSTFGPSWAGLFEMVRSGNFSIIFGAQSIGSLTDKMQGLSKEFMERVMANVNLKICMRVGDDETASALSKWMGTVERVKRSVSRSRTLFNPAEKARSLSNTSVTEEEVEAVSADSLKHELSTEKGLAWFDLGNGRVTKGRTLWLDAEIPQSWPARKHLITPIKSFCKMLRLSNWIDRQVLEKTGNEVKAKEDPYPMPPLPSWSSLPPLPPIPQKTKVVAETGSSVSEKKPEEEEVVVAPAPAVAVAVPKPVEEPPKVGKLLCNVAIIKPSPPPPPAEEQPSSPQQLEPQPELLLSQKQKRQRQVSTQVQVLTPNQIKLHQQKGQTAPNKKANKDAPKRGKKKKKKKWDDVFRTNPEIEARILKAGHTNITKVTFDEESYKRQLERSDD